MRTITDYKEAANLCQTFTGHLVARANKTLNGIYRPYCLLNDDLTPLFCWNAQLCVQLYLGGYLLRNGGVLIASKPDAEHITFKMGAPEDAAGFDKNGNSVA